MADKYELPQVAVRLVKEPPLISDTPIDSARTAISVMGKFLSDMDRELVCVVSLQTDGKPINMSVCSIGGINYAVAEPREIMKSAILSNASSIIMIHNHPSGHLTPSQEDIAITDRLRYTGELLGIPLVDHVITGRNGQYYSFAEEGILPDYDICYAKNKEELRNASHANVDEARVAYRASAYSRQEVKRLTEQLEKGVKDLFESDRYREYLQVMSRFHQYSFNNSLLISMQRPDASLVAGYKAWQTKFHRHVKAGEKGIRILSPNPHIEAQEVPLKDPKTGAPVLDGNGDPVTEQRPVVVITYKPTTVFDVSQTDGEELPELAKPLEGEVQDYNRFIDTLQDVSPAPMEFCEIKGRAKGYYQPKDKTIGIQIGMSQQQTVKTCIHELAHAVLHAEKETTPDANTREVQAESVAYTVCSHYGIDTSDYSFGYIAGWSEGKDTKELKESMTQIRVASSWIISEMDKRLYPEREKQQEEARNTEMDKRREPDKRNTRQASTGPVPRPQETAKHRAR